MFPVLESKPKELTEADKPITSAFSNETNEIRYWKIEGFAQMPYGGTHIKHTGRLVLSG